MMDKVVKTVVGAFLIIVLSFVWITFGVLATHHELQQVEKPEVCRGEFGHRRECP